MLAVKFYLLADCFDFLFVVACLNHCGRKFGFEFSLKHSWFTFNVIELFKCIISWRHGILQFCILGLVLSFKVFYLASDLFNFFFRHIQSIFGHFDSSLNHIPELCFIIKFIEHRFSDCSQFELVIKQILSFLKCFTLLLKFLYNSSYFGAEKGQIFFTLLAFTWFHRPWICDGCQSCLSEFTIGLGDTFAWLLSLFWTRSTHFWYWFNCDFLHKFKTFTEKSVTVG